MHGRCTRRDATGNFVFFDRAREFLDYLGGLSGFDLLSERVLVYNSRLREALYMDLSRCWSSYGGAVVTRSIHPEWGSTSISLSMGSRFGASCVHGASCGYSMLSDHLFSIGKATSSLCRNGCGVTEDLDHILLHCECFSEPRSRIRSLCLTLGITFCVRNLLAHPKVHPLTEEIFA